jgi:fluoride exporter
VASEFRVSWAHLGLVVLGGAIGTAARIGLLLTMESPPWRELAVPVVNVVGSLLLGLLLGALSGVSGARGRRMHAFLATGVLGGFTTYSTFALEAVQAVAVWSALVTVTAGLAAAALGLWLADAWRRRGTTTGAERV